MRKRLFPFHLVILATVVTTFLSSLQAEDWSFVARLNRALDDIVPLDAKVEKLAGSFGFLEGPVWVRKSGYLLFSDIPANVIYKWSPTERKASIFLAYSGFTGSDDSGSGMQLNDGQGTVTLLGSNAVTLDPQGRVVYCAHGDRQVVRLEADGRRTVVASQFEGKRLNSPNDLVYKSDGALYFTDPPFGLPKFFDDPRKELPYSGVFRVSADGTQVRLLTTELKGPNGLAFSPDEKYFYVDNWDPERKIVMRYEVSSDGGLANGAVFFDMTSAEGEDALDGMKIDQKGNLYVSGPGGLWIISPEGKHLGTIIGPEHPHNFAWGDDDAKTLYLCAKTGLYRIRLNVPGIRP